jgi:SAM-dependent methyltransferase
MNDVTKPPEDQRALWNGRAGDAWVDNQALLDQMFRPIEELLVAVVAAGTSPEARAVLDVGCGTGVTTLAVARLPGAAGRCTGADISEPMIALARRRAEAEGTGARFVVADAQTHPFEPASFDAFISRFGVMFFEDPIAAFANLRRAARPGAILRCIAWRSAADNPFMTTAERAIAPLVPNLPPRKPDGPGQFAFADAPRVRAILEGGGWSDVDLAPLDIPCAFPEAALNSYLTRLGPLGLVLPTLDEPTRARVLEVARAAFDSFVHGDEVRYTAACWMLNAGAR